MRSTACAAASCERASARSRTAPAIGQARTTAGLVAQVDHPHERGAAPAHYPVGARRREAIPADRPDVLLDDRARRRH